MPSLTVENYLKATLLASMKNGTEWVSTGELATALDVSPGTVTSMLKTLADSGLANYKPYSGVSLTKSGRKLAMRMLRRHRLIELFLTETLKLSWDRVHEEAENMEHSVSDFLIDQIDIFLGHPQCDPHGDPIPTSDGKLRGDQSSVLPLSECPRGALVRFVRVINQEPEFLRFLSDSGFEIGATATVTMNSTEAGIVTAEVGSRVLSLGLSAAEHLLVQVENSQPSGKAQAVKGG